MKYLLSFYYQHGQIIHHMLESKERLTLEDMRDTVKGFQEALDNTGGLQITDMDNDCRTGTYVYKEGLVGIQIERMDNEHQS